jgi:hypothetical protein
MYISIQANSLSLDSVIRAVSTTKIGIESQGLGASEKRKKNKCYHNLNG